MAIFAYIKHDFIWYMKPDTIYHVLDATMWDKFNDTSTTKRVFIFKNKKDAMAAAKRIKKDYEEYDGYDHGLIFYFNGNERIYSPRYSSFKLSKLTITSMCVNDIIEIDVD